MADFTVRRQKELSDVSTLLSSRIATRVATIVRAGSSLSGKGSSEVISDALSALKLSEEHLFLVREQWKRYDILVFDLFNTNYDWKTAHLRSDLPVVLLDYGRRELRMSVAAPMIQLEVNDGVAQHHNLNGWHAQPPYVADHTLPCPPSYEAPRSMRHSSPDSSSSEAVLSL